MDSYLKHYVPPSKFFKAYALDLNRMFLQGNNFYKDVIKKKKTFYPPLLTTFQKIRNKEIIIIVIPGELTATLYFMK